MAGSFDPNDKNSWYFGAMGRDETNRILLGEREAGVFLVRDSSTIPGDYVLSVKEDNKVSHYIVNKIQVEEQVKFRIGDQVFPDFPSLLRFYKLHYLDTTPLIQPATKKSEKVIARYDFDGRDPDDLPFRKGEVLEIVSKDEQQWWTARNMHGQTGSIPVNYVQKFDETQEQLAQRLSYQQQQQQQQSLTPTRNSIGSPESRLPSVERKLPALARVKQARNPCAYDNTQLKLEVGEVIKVLEMNLSGQWKGELNGKVGHFPFTHVEFIDDNENEEDTGC
ncbi:PREDICTED: adapter molecule Crk-like [Priapulus caudatus]|uniref:Adapter molecule Crk-like n=1 Tax=Priapulus caudatus TaxID=37621 RepID=A0ABM1DT43_PRICU|nr:PREDICTED: adapter molecule Crk-like [Priapulus caudatus]XP_014663183.1 PREDICTED: adapter molecule Crk-like [Priapulus caudatus]